MTPASTLRNTHLNPDLAKLLTTFVVYFTTRSTVCFADWTFIFQSFSSTDASILNIYRFFSSDQLCYFVAHYFFFFVLFVRMWHRSVTSTTQPDGFDRWEYLGLRSRRVALNPTVIVRGRSQNNSVSSSMWNLIKLMCHSSAKKTNSLLKRDAFVKMFAMWLLGQMWDKRSYTFFIPFICFVLHYVSSFVFVSVIALLFLLIVIVAHCDTLPKVLWLSLLTTTHTQIYIYIHSSY